MHDWLRQLIGDVIDNRISDDARTTDTTYLGWPRNRVFRDVIGGGQADFDVQIGHLTSDDRALLYAKFNQVRHLEELVHAFNRLLGESGRVHCPILIDIGCGPFTAGLSFAACFGPQGPFRYFGVDRASSMLRLGALLAEEAAKLDAIHPLTSVTFAQSLSDISFGPARGEWTIVVASYLLASPTVDPGGLVADILTTLERVGPGPVAVLYTNSANRYADAKYPEFRDTLIKAEFDVRADAVERFLDTTKEPKDMHYALFYRPAKNTLNV